MSAETGRLRAVTVASAAIILPDPNPIVVLREIEQPWRELALPVGLTEGISISSALQQARGARPNTHELFTEVMGAYSITVQRLVITRVQDGIFYGELELAQGTELRTASCRPSDGVALALRQHYGVPIVVAEDVLMVAGRVRSALP